jgi:hypothetical protein
MTGNGLNVTLVLLMLPGCAPPLATGDNTQEQQEISDTTGAMFLETSDGFSDFIVTGKHADFGSYIAVGEATLVASQKAGVLQEGTGVAVLHAENGDHIVADVTCKVTDMGFDFTFHWRDSVTFRTGSTLPTTGAFVNRKPPGLALSSVRGFDQSGGSGIVCGECCRWACDTKGACTYICEHRCIPLWSFIYCGRRP